MTAKRALVLAGGGVAGIAWETGVLQGIADEAPASAQALRDADVLVGTSAGSAVAAQLGSAAPLAELFDRQLSPTTAEIDPGVAIEDITALFLEAMQRPDATKAQKLQRIGEIAASAPTVSEAVRREVIAHRLPAPDWPDRDLRIAAIDIATGELVCFDRTWAVAVVDAVAASCAVPGVWPPVTIGDRRYMDGGVGSTVNMALAADCASAVALVPSGRNAPSPFSAGAAREIDEFGGPTFAVFADDASLSAFGANPLDPACRAASARAGRDQGRRVAAEITEFLG